MVLYSLILFVFLHDFDKTCENGVYSAFQWFDIVFFWNFTPWIVKSKPPVTFEILIFMKSCNIIFCSESKDLSNDTHHFWIRNLKFWWSGDLKAKIRVFHTDLACIPHIFEIYTQKLTKKSCWEIFHHFLRIASCSSRLYWGKKMFSVFLLFWK